MNAISWRLPIASLYAERVDALIASLLVMILLTTCSLALSILFLVVRYRRSRRPATPPETKVHIPLEIVWTAVPLLVFLWFFAWGGRLYLEAYQPAPADAYSVYVVGKQWMWKFQHRNGVQENNRLHVPAGAPIRLVMISQDVVHSLFIPALRIKHDVLPGRFSTLTLSANVSGRFPIFCAEYCGTEHSMMRAEIEILEPARFQHWLVTNSNQGSMANRGRGWLEKFGCRECHRTDATSAAPRLEGLFGKAVRLTDGSLVRADESYLLKSILDPSAELVAGYLPMMPSYRNALSESELNDIIAYLESQGAVEGEPSVRSELSE